MPRKVPQETLNLWRQMDAEGKSYKEIGKQTQWDPRTVAQHLKTEIRFAEPDDIRRELFKESLKDHWEMLITETVDSLKATHPFEPWTFHEAVASASPYSFEIGGAKVFIDSEGKIQVQAIARALRSTELLAQHIPTDSLWRALTAWENTEAADVRARRRLHEAAKKILAKTSAWPLVADSQEDKEMGLLPGATDLVYEIALSRALGLTNRDRRADAYSKNWEGVVESSPFRVARVGDDPTAVHALIERCIQKIVPAKEAMDAAESYRKVQKVTGDLHRILDDLRLLIYLPGVCDVCARFSGPRMQKGA